MLYGDWSKLFVTLCGTAGALVTGMMPQWRNEKWATRTLDYYKDGQKTRGARKITALTRGNGYAHVMVFVNDGVGWDVEAMANQTSWKLRPSTRPMSLLLTLWWTLLLITCAGLHDNTWYLIGVGGLGMLQNIYVAAAKRPMGAFDFHYRLANTITGRPKDKKTIVEPSDAEPADNPNPLESIGGVMGALMEFEKQHPGCGMSLVEVFFPGSVAYEEARFPFNREKKFWKWADTTKKARKKNMEAEREIMRAEVEAKVI
jgi:hypothetical protein